jgi:hypothetical protein
MVGINQNAIAASSFGHQHFVKIGAGDCSNEISASFENGFMKSLQVD